MSKEFEGTPGPWVVHQRPNAPFEYGHHVTTADGLTVCKVSYQLPAATPAGVRESERIANAQLIAEAGTVLHETGLTPRQLAEQRAELLEALTQLLYRKDEQAGRAKESTSPYAKGAGSAIEIFAEEVREAIANATQQRNATGGEG